MCIEYLGYYGPDTVCSVRADLYRYRNYKCGGSLAAFQKLTERFGYQFVTCDTMGVNCFFYLPDRMQQLVESSLRNSDEFVWLPGVRVLVVDDGWASADRWAAPLDQS